MLLALGTSFVVAASEAILYLLWQTHGKSSTPKSTLEKRRRVIPNSKKVDSAAAETKDEAEVPLADGMRLRKAVENDVRS